MPDVMEFDRHAGQDLLGRRWNATGSEPRTYAEVAGGSSPAVRGVDVLDDRLAAVVLVWRQLGADPAGQAPPASNSPVRVTAAVPADVKLPTRVEFDKLEPVAEAPAASRNPFRFGVPPPPPPPPKPAYVAPVLPPPGPPPPPPGPPPPPPINGLLRFEGRIVAPDGKIAAAIGVLDSTRANVNGVVWATEGQVIDGRFRVIKIGLETVVIEYVNGTGRTTLQK
jgi:hypothetical protein